MQLFMHIHMYIHENGGLSGLTVTHRQEVIRRDKITKMVYFGFIQSQTTDT